MQQPQSPFFPPLPPLPTSTNASKSEENWNLSFKTLYDFLTKHDALLVPGADKGTRSAPSSSPSAGLDCHTAIVNHLGLGSGPPNADLSQAQDDAMQNTVLPEQFKKCADDSLIAWVANQRRYALRWEAGLSSPMTSDRLAQLNSIHFFDLFTTRWEEIWQMNYNLLKRHYLKHGNYTSLSDEAIYKLPSFTNTSDATNNADNGDGDGVGDGDILTISQRKFLNSWMKKQRKEHQKLEHGQKSTMTRTRLDLLDAISFNFNDISNTKTDLRFEQRLDELRHYKDVHGHVRIAKVYKPDKSLGRWVARQRAQYRLYQNDPKASTLTEEKIAKLEELGFEWTSTLKHSPNITWMARYNDLTEYKSRYGDCNVPKRWKEDICLGAWTRNQRAQYWAKKRGKRSPMTEERIRLLNHVGFQWKVRGC